MKYLYIPVDNRPCNALFPRQLARMQGVELLTPPPDIADDFLRPSDFEALNAWLWEHSGEASALILSVENYVLGSLLNSRKSEIPPESCQKRLEELRRLAQTFPQLKIYAFSVLMRTSISTLSQESLENWKLVNEYSQVCHKAELGEDPAAGPRKRELERQIPADVLEVFLSSRRRNASVNQSCVELVRDGVFRTLAIVQEDSTLYGLHKKEQKELEARIEGCRVQDRVFIHNGTDEAGCLLLARAVADERKRGFPLSYLYLNDNRDSFVASYEDRLFQENLRSHAATAGIQLTDGDGQKDVLVIYSPKAKQYEASLGEGEPPCDYTPAQLDEFAGRVAALVRAGKRVYFLDVAYANGGQGDILRRIHRHADVTRLWGYAAWNTASNSLGTILAQAALCQDASEEENRRFTLERLLDDFAYQGVVRQRLARRLRADGEEPLCLKDKPAADRELQALMEDFVRQEPIFGREPPRIVCQLPWPRIFEAEVRLADGEFMERERTQCL